MKVSQQIDEYEPHRTNSTDVSDEGERFSSLEAPVVSPILPVGQSLEGPTISPEPNHPRSTLGRFSLGYGDDELLAEQVRCLDSKRAVGKLSRKLTYTTRLCHLWQEQLILQKSQHPLNAIGGATLMSHRGPIPLALHWMSRLMWMGARCYILLNHRASTTCIADHHLLICLITANYLRHCLPQHQKRIC